MNTNNESNTINATPEQGVIPFPYSSTSSPILVNVDSIVFGDTVSLIDIDPNLIEEGDDFQASDLKWVALIKATHESVLGYNKKMKHWRKQQLDAAIKCGEYLNRLSSINMSCIPMLKTLWKRYLSDYFCYRTARRYLTLYIRRNELPPDVCSIRQAYVNLGIIKVVDNKINDGEEEEDSPDTSNATPGGPSNLSNGGISKSNSTSIKKLQNKYSDSLLTTLTHQGETQCVAFRFENENLCVNIIGSDCSFSSTEDSDQLLLKKLKPFVEWYNMAITDYQTLTVTPSTTNDGPDLEIAA